jgi:hypothetical protein
MLSPGDLVLLALSGVFSLWIGVAIYSLFRRDQTPPMGHFESYAARIGNMGEEHWGKLRLDGGLLSFKPHDSQDAVTIPLADLTRAEFPWGSRMFTLHFDWLTWRFATSRRGLPPSRDVGGVNWHRVREEWKRQFKAAGIPMETDDAQQQVSASPRTPHD